MGKITFISQRFFNIQKIEINTRELGINFNNISSDSYSEGEGKFKGDWHALRELRGENSHGYKQQNGLVISWKRRKTLKAKYVTYKKYILGKKSQENVKLKEYTPSKTLEKLGRGWKWKWERHKSTNNHTQFGSNNNIKNFY